MIEMVSTLKDTGKHIASHVVRQKVLDKTPPGSYTYTVRGCLCMLIRSMIRRSLIGFTRYSGRIGRHIEYAARIAQQSDFPDYRHGAILVKGSSILNTSTNKSNYCSFGHRFRRKAAGHATLHAELGAILGMDRTVTEGATIYVARVGKTGAFKLSKPCSMCHAAMKHVGIKRVVYTINDKVAGSYKI